MLWCRLRHRLHHMGGGRTRFHGDPSKGCSRTIVLSCEQVAPSTRFEKGASKEDNRLRPRRYVRGLRRMVQIRVRRPLHAQPTGNEVDDTVAVNVPYLRQHLTAGRIVTREQRGVVADHGSTSLALVPKPCSLDLGRIQPTYLDAVVEVRGGSKAQLTTPWTTTKEKMKGF